MPKVSAYSDDDILNAIESLSAQGKRVKVASIAELVPVNRNRIQRIMTAWQKGKVSLLTKSVEIPEATIAALRSLLEQIIVQARESAYADFQGQLEDALALQTDIASDRDAALRDIEAMRSAKEQAEKKEVAAQAMAEEALRQADQIRLEAKDAAERAVRAEERAKMSEEYAQKVVTMAELAEKKAEAAEKEASLIKQECAQANATANSEKEARERAELACERAAQNAKEQSAAEAAATAKVESLVKQLAEATQRAERAENKAEQLLKEMSSLREELSALKERYDHALENLSKAEAGNQSTAVDQPAVTRRKRVERKKREDSIDK